MARTFTLLELLVAVAIAAILVAIAIPVFHEQRLEARRSEVRLTLNGIADAQEMYRADSGSYTRDFRNLVYPDGAPYYIYGFCTGTGIYNTRVALLWGVTAFSGDNMFVDGTWLQSDDLPDLTETTTADSFVVGAAGSADKRNMETWARNDTLQDVANGGVSCAGASPPCVGLGAPCFADGQCCSGSCNPFGTCD